MTAPTFVAQYSTAFNTGSTPKTAISAVAVSAGDVLVGVAARESGENGPTLNLTENGAGAWTVQDRYGTTSATVEALSATYVASAETLTVTVTSPASLFFGGNVVRFSGSDGVGAHAQASGSGSPSVNITTTQANSAIVVIVGDWNAVSGTQTFTSAGGAGSATALTGSPGDAAHYGVAIAYYPDAGAAGSKTVGMSAPTGQQYSILAVEVKGTAGGGSASITGAGAIASAQAFGGATLSPSVLPTGVTSAQAFGSATLSPSVLPTGVASAQAFGSPSLGWNALLMGVGGISSTEAIGAPSLLVAVAPSGVTSAQAFGGAGVSLSVAATGVGTGEAFGQPNLTWGVLAQNLVDVGGISSAQAFGQPTLTWGVLAQNLVGVGGISSTGAVGSPSLPVAIAPSGVASAQAQGLPVLSAAIVATGVATGEAVGVPGYVGPPLGAQNLVDVGGIVSEGAVGRPTLTYISKTGGDDLPWRKSPHKGYDRQKARQKVIDDHRQTKELEQIYSAITGTAAVPAKVKKEAAAIVVPYVKDGVRKGVVSAQSIDWNGFAQNLQRASELVTLYQQNIEDEEMAMMLLLLTAA